MSRPDLKIEEGGFPIYGQKNLKKINAIRRAISLPGLDTPVIPTKGQALFTTAEEMHDEPSSCYNCTMYNEKNMTCTLMGPRITVRKIIYPKDPTADSKQIEYWPCCSMQYYGGPNKGEPMYHGQSDPDYLDLVWINAPEVGQEYGGANCGGVNGGDDCDRYITEGTEEKWESATGFCRALQTTVACGDVCSLWSDDDELHWREAQEIIKEQDGKRGKEDGSS